MRKTTTKTGNFTRLIFSTTEELKQWVKDNDLKGIFAIVSFYVNYKTLEVIY